MITKTKLKEQIELFRMYLPLMILLTGCLFLKRQNEA